MNTFGAFEQGQIVLPSGRKNAVDVEWSKHPVFKGVELKHLITSKDTDGQFSYHLVRIAPECSIGLHIHETQLETHEVIEGSGICNLENEAIPYHKGVIAVIPAGKEHEVKAGGDGLYLFAKFIPPLC